MADVKNNKSKALEVKKDAPPPAVLDDMFAQDSALGKENIRAEDLAIPFFALLQSNSPQVKKTEGAYIKGAEEGMVLNTVTRELFKAEEGILVVPCFYERVALEWRPRKAGGGLVTIYHGDERDKKVGECTRVTNEEGKSIDRLPNGNDLVVAAQHYVLRLREGGWEPGLFSLASTQLKKSRRWNALMSGIQLKTKDGRVFNPPSFSHIYRATAVPESRDKYSWWGWNMDIMERVSDPELYAAAKAFHQSCSKGEVRASEQQMEAAANAGGGAPLNDDIPF